MRPDAPSTRESHALPGPLAAVRPGFLFRAMRRARRVQAHAAPDD
jgi:hypothetical protein